MTTKKQEPVRPPVKANLIIVRGRDGAEVRGEDWSRIQHEVYMTLLPKREERMDFYYDLVVLVPGMEPMVSEAVMWHGCNCLAVDKKVVNHL